jgi:exonuclease SbcC
MKPLNLIIEGLYSYQSRQEIDFTKLTDAHLFGIFGTVGSGKSSILEAITFALYGLTDKLNARDNRAYNMMNLKSDSLYIEFDFAIEDKSYKAIVKSRRNSKKFTDVKKLERSFYQKTDNEFVPVEEKVIHEAIGLSYDNFKRTIIIPQGQFKDFLELGDADRTKMLKELFHLEKYDLYDKLRPLISKNLTDMNILKGQLESLGDVNIEELALIETSLLDLKKEIEILSKDLDSKNKEADSFKKIKELKEKEKEAIKKLDTLKNKEAEYKLLEDKLKSYEYCFMNFKQDIDSRESLRKDINTLKEELTAKRKSFDINTKELDEKKKAFVLIKKAYDSREEFKKQIEELKKIEQILSLDEEILKIKNGIDLLTSDLKNKSEDHKTIREVCEKLAAEIEKEKTLLPDINILNELKDWYNTDYIIHKEIRSNEDSLKTLIKEMDESSKEALAFYMDEAIDKSLQAVYHSLEKNKNSLKESIKPIDQELDNLGIQKKLEEYASLLEDGKACPLCGSERHPSIMNSKQVGFLLEEYKKKKDVIENKITLIENNQSSLQKLIIRIETKEEHRNDILKNLKLNKDTLLEHAKLFVWDKYKTADDLKKGIALYTEKQNLISSLDKSLKENSKKKELLDNELKNKEKNLTSIENSLKENLSISKTLSSQLSLLKLEDYSSMSKQDISTQFNEWENKYNKLEFDYNKVYTEIEGLEGGQNELKGLISACDSNLKKDLKNESLLHEKLIKNIDESDFSDIEQAKTILLLNINLPVERERLDDYRKMLSTVNSELTALRKELKDKLYDEEKHLEIILLIKELSSKKDALNTSMGKLQAEMDKLRKDLKKLKDLKKEEKALSLRGADLDTLKRLFTGSGFVNYVSSVHLNNLCVAANDRFHKLTGQTLSLEMTENNNFQIRDYMNGGNVRSVKTLSGGQTFQASLALALALTDSIQTFNNSKQNFFFLDEGFGSLDKDALSVVFEALKSLKKENRVVGVISHVEELQQEMGVFVKVVNNAERGSELTFSWD